MIRFLTCNFRLLEIDDETASASLTDAYEQYVGYPPDFNASGDAATGFHVPGAEAGERQVVFSRSANKNALRRAVTLIATRHRLANLRIVTHPSFAADQPTEDDWEPDLIERPYAIDGVAVWPAAASVRIRDVLVLELRSRPGTFIPPTLTPTPVLDEAMTFSDAQAAWSCAAALAHDGGIVRPVWRAAALAALDQQGREEG